MKCKNCEEEIEGVAVYRTLKPTYKIIVLCFNCSKIFNKQESIKEKKYQEQLEYEQYEKRQNEIDNERKQQIQKDNLIVIDKIREEIRGKRCPCCGHLKD
jgi:hypothetical protein